MKIGNRKSAGRAASYLKTTMPAVEDRSYGPTKFGPPRTPDQYPKATSYRKPST